MSPSLLLVLLMSCVASRPRLPQRIAAGKFFKTSSACKPQKTISALAESRPGEDLNRAAGERETLLRHRGLSARCAFMCFFFFFFFNYYGCRSNCFSKYAVAVRSRYFPRVCTTFIQLQLKSGQVYFCSIYENFVVLGWQGPTRSMFWQA